MTSILKVSTIQDPTNSNTALTIDSAGRVLMPSRPAFKAYAGSNYTRDFSTSGEALVDFDTEAFDVGSNYNNASGQSKFVAPVTGVYYFSTTIRMNGISGPAYAYIRFYKNGSAATGGAAVDITSTFGTSYHTFQMQDMFQLTAGDYIQIYCQTPGDSSVEVEGDQANFSGYLLA